MFAKYTILFAILALFATQGAQAVHHIENADERSLADIVHKAEEAFARLRQTIDSAIDSAKHELADVRDAIIANAEIILAQAEQAIKTEMGKVRELIKKMKHEAELVDVDVQECVLDSQEELEQIPRIVIQKLIECIEIELNKVRVIVDAAIKQVMGLKEKLVTLPAKLESCLKGADKINCIRMLIANVVHDISALPSIIQESVNQIIKVVAELEANLKACAASKLLEASRDAAAVGANVAKCVADKIRA